MKVQKVIDVSRKYLGYIEKASNANLDSKEGNKGTKNYTRFSRDVNAAGLMGCQGQAWCGTSQFAFEIEAYGVDQALKNWNMTRKTYVGYNCFSTYNTFKKAGKVSKVPKLGCLVIFTFSHMGRVIDIQGNKITTIEGNTSAKTYDRNGGMVAMKTYSINDPKIKGFCIIDYDETATKPTASTPAKNSVEANVKKGQKWLNSNYPEQIKLYCGALLAEDGDCGEKTRAACIAVWKDLMNRKYGAALNPKNSNFLSSSKKAAKKAEIKKGSSGTLVLIAQLILSAKGFYTGAMNAKWGGDIDEAVEAFQRSEGLAVDRIIGANSWFALFN